MAPGTSTIGATLGLVSGSTVLTVTASGPSISGTVTGTGDVPLAGIDVLASSPSGGDGYATTAADGTYTVAVPPGQAYVLQFSDPSTTYGDGFYASAAAGHFTPDYSLASDVVVGSSDVGGIDITLPLLVHITGNVSGAGIGPLAGIDVYAVPTSLSFFSSTTEADGSYSVAVLPGQAYQIQFYDPNLVYGGGFYDSSAGDGYASDGALATDVVVDTGDVGGIDVTLPLAVHISGTVTGPGGVPLAGIDVAALPTDLGWGGYATTGADGTYSAAVPPGLSYRLRFSDPEGTYAIGNYDSTAPGHYVPDTSPGTAVVVDSSDVSDIDIELPASATAPGAPTGVTATAGDGIGRSYLDRARG